MIRVRVKNENATEDWRGLIGAIESRDYTAGTTAELAYEAEKLTPLGGATIVEKAVASGGKVVEHASLTAGWLTILGSEIAGVGHMTHKGVRRMKFRVFDPNASVGLAQLKLEWRALGSTTWSEDSGVVSAPLVGNYQIIDMGECRPEQAALGSQRWEWRLMARAPGGSGAIRVDRIGVLPVEQMVMLSTPAEPRPADHQSSKAPGTVEDKEGVGTKAWTEPGNAKASDNKYASATLTGGLTSHYLKATNFGFALPEAATVTGIVAAVERSGLEVLKRSHVRDARVRIVKGGTIGAADRSSPNEWPLTDAQAFYGASNDLWGETWTPTQINASTFGVALAAEMLPAPPEEAGVGAYVDAVTITVYYTEAADENRVCFATRSLEMRSDGVYRQHPTADVWGRMVPEGFLPYAPASGLEKRKVRGIIVPSKGDLGELPDEGTNKVSVKVSYRPAYLLSREAL